ncbi:hypothetical protein ACQKWADRAFT_26384 [Trichoderma austrokoningii]
MPLFTSPTPTNKQVRTWDEHVRSWGGGYEQWHGVDYNLSEPRALWGAYWERFNMIQIPIFPRDEFFEIAIGIAKVAKNKDDFKRIFEQENKERLAELEAFLSKGNSRWSLHDEDHFPSRDAFIKTMRACRDPCFSNMMLLLKGNAFGWEADYTLDEEPINKPVADPNDDYQDPNMETQYIDYWDEEYDGDMEPVTCIPDENFTLPKATTNGSPSSAQGKRKRVPFDDDGAGLDEQQLQQLDNSASDSVSQNSPSILQAAQQGTSTPNDDERIHKRRRLERSPARAASPRPSTEAKKSEKRSRHDGDDSLRKRQRIESPTEVPTAHASSPGQATRGKMSKKRYRHDDEDDGSPKRQKLETSAAQTPNANALPSPPAVEQRTSKKRSRQDDGSNGSQKRQKREITAASDTASHTASQPAVNDKSGSRNKDSRQRGSQKRKSRARSPPPKSPNTRSSRRNGSATLWELDGSGKAKLR